MFCTSCGSKLADGARFCTSCGAPAEVAPVPVPMVEEPVAAPTYEEGVTEKLPSPTPTEPIPAAAAEPAAEKGPIFEPMAVDTKQIAPLSVKRAQRLLSLCTHPLMAIAAVFRTLGAIVMLVLAIALPVLLFAEDALEIFVEAEEAAFIFEVLEESGDTVLLLSVLALFVLAIASIMTAIGAWATLAGGCKDRRTAANGCLVVQFGSYLSAIGVLLAAVAVVLTYGAYVDVIGREFGLVYNAVWIIGLGGAIGAAVVGFSLAKKITLGSLAWRMQRNLAATADEKRAFRAGGTGTASLYLLSAVLCAVVAVMLLSAEVLGVVEAILATVFCFMTVTDAVIGSMALVHYGVTLRLLRE